MARKDNRRFIKNISKKYYIQDIDKCLISFTTIIVRKYRYIIKI